MMFKQYTWEDAIVDAKAEMGYAPNAYVKNWDKVIELAKEYLEAELRGTKEDLIDDLSVEGRLKHKEYLNSSRWKRLRRKVLFRDSFACVDCKKKAVDVHHLNGNYMFTDQEINYCVSLCRNCHRRRHGWK